MKEFNPAMLLIKDESTGKFTQLDYTFFEPGDRYEQINYSQEQINSYGNNLPGIRIEVNLQKIGPGNPFTFSESIMINQTLTLDNDKPYVMLEIYTVNPTTSERTRKGGGIVRAIYPPI